METSWIKARQTKFSAYVLVYTLVVIGVLGAINFLANRHNKSVDTTANKRFSLSDQTEKVVKGLKSDVTITYYDQTGRFGNARDLLDRYDNLSTKLNVAYVDPEKNPTQARAAGIKTLGQIIVNNGTKREEARSLTEEEITGALIRTLKEGERTVCFITGSGEHGIDDSGRRGYSQLKESLEKTTYKTRAISLLEKPEVPKDCTVLVVGGPRFDYAAPAVAAIKTYVEGGGHAMFLLDPVLKMGKEETAENAELVKQLDAWGVTLNKDLALDTSGVGQIFGLSEVIPLVTSYETHVIVREMKEVATAFPMARTVDVKSGAEKLFSTSANSFATTNLSSPEIRINPEKDKKGPLALGAAGTTGNKGRFVVIGSSDWASNGFLRFNGNRDLFLNSINWLSSDEELISIRPKDPEDRRLSLTARQMSLVFWSTVVFIPLIVVFAGFSVYWRRR